MGIVKTLSDLDLTDLDRTGGKAARLGVLIREGLPVPPGFCIVVDACERFVRDNGLDALIDKLLGDKVAVVELGTLEIAYESISEAFTAGRMPPEMEEEILKAFQETVGIESVSVRSSSVLEDRADVSFAGLHDTILNVNPDGIPKAVQTVWASLWKPAAIRYRNRHGLKDFDAKIAVIVQKMFPSDSAGVAFTINPLTGNVDEIMVEAARGLGEGLVSGRVTPDRFIVNKQTLSLLEKKIDNQESCCLLDGSSGTRMVDMPPENASLPSISEELLGEICRLSLRCERCFEGPQDVEWAFHGDGVVILQSRPVTSVFTTGERPDKWVSEFDTVIDERFPAYTSANISEVLPGVLTPLTISGLPALESGFRNANRMFGLLDLPPDPPEFLFLGIFYGRAHLNLSTIRLISHNLPMGAAQELDRPMPGDGGRTEGREGTLSLWKFPIFLRIIRKALRIGRRTPNEVHSFRDYFLKRMDEVAALDFSALSASELVERMNSAEEDWYRLMDLHIVSSQFAVAYFGTIRKITSHWLKDAHGTLASRLVTGISGLESAKPGFGIWNLSRFAIELPEVRAIFEEMDDDVLLAALKGRRETSSEVARFWKRLEEFLGDYGFWCPFGAETMYPCWSEDPRFVVSMVRGYLSLLEEQSPQAIEARQKADQEAAFSEAIDGLPPWGRWALKRTLRGAITFIRLRETMKSLLMRGAHMVKRIAREYACRLVSEGTLFRKEDIYFITRDEITDIVVSGKPPDDLMERIRRRRAEYARNLTIELPETFTGHPVPLTIHTEGEKEDTDENVLRGIPVSPGNVTGPARVVLDPTGRGGEFQPGEILVAPITDAGWTPLFLIASAVVVDVGGLLSHGSIVAREYGLPGVINVKHGTKRIKTGQIITVDGNQGRVILNPRVC